MPAMQFYGAENCDKSRRIKREQKETQKKSKWEHFQQQNDNIVGFDCGWSTKGKSIVFLQWYRMLILRCNKFQVHKKRFRFSANENRSKKNVEKMLAFTWVVCDKRFCRCDSTLVRSHCAHHICSWKWRCLERNKDTRRDKENCIDDSNRRIAVSSPDTKYRSHAIFTHRVLCAFYSNKIRLTAKCWIEANSWETQKHCRVCFSPSGSHDISE